MRFICLLLLSVVVSSCSLFVGEVEKNTYITIFNYKNKISPVDEGAVKNLPKNIKASLAYLSSKINTGCIDGSCKLTQALGFEKQCGDEHIKFIQKYFDDFNKEDCVYMEDGSESYTWYNTISFVTDGTYIHFDNRISWLDNGKKTSEREVRTIEIMDKKLFEQKLL